VGLSPLGELCALFRFAAPGHRHVLHGTTIGTNAVLLQDGR